MKGTFIQKKDIKHVDLEWGEQSWFSCPEMTGTQALVVLEVEIYPSYGHSFHRHPRQEEVLIVLEGEVEQWLEKESKILTQGESVFIPTDVVHATFNTSDKPVRALAILGPSIGSEGYEMVEVYEEEPWNSLRS